MQPSLLEKREPDETEATNEVLGRVRIRVFRAITHDNIERLREVIEKGMLFRKLYYSLVIKCGSETENNQNTIYCNFSLFC